MCTHFITQYLECHSLPNQLWASSTPPHRIWTEMTKMFCFWTTCTYTVSHDTLGWGTVSFFADKCSTQVSSCLSFNQISHSLKIVSKSFDCVRRTNFGPPLLSGHLKQQRNRSVALCAEENKEFCWSLTWRHYKNVSKPSEHDLIATFWL